MAGPDAEAAAGEYGKSVPRIDYTIAGSHLARQAAFAAGAAWGYALALRCVARALAGKTGYCETDPVVI
jgi:hypothetical protein